MSPIPGEPLEPKQHGLTTSDGRKFKLKGLGIKPLGPIKTEERGSEEPPVTVIVYMSVTFAPTFSSPLMTALGSRLSSHFSPSAFWTVTTSSVRPGNLTSMRS